MLQQHEEAWLKLEKARPELTDIGSRPRAAQCLRNLGVILLSQV